MAVPSKETYSPQKAEGEKAAAAAHGKRRAKDEADQSRDPSWPASYAPDLATRILVRIERGDSLKQIEDTEPGAPPRSTIMRWVTEDVHGFAERYARARETALDVMAEDILIIADDHNLRFDPAQVQAAKLRVDTRKWLLSKLAPKKYGDRLQVDATVEQRYSTMDDRELLATMRDLAERLQFTMPSTLPMFLGVDEQDKNAIMPLGEGPMMSSDNIKVIGGPMDGQVVGWRRSVVMVRRETPNSLSTPGWTVDDKPRKEVMFVYARFSRPSGSFYAPRDWTWDDIIAQLTKHSTPDGLST
ncbi:MAG: hypothetical protein K1Y02_26585 [Candidatus Hydrogenedentes bacterium]|nr:hypothetical protein [Candidatus Hydrogenedentota bacterium]